MGQAAVIASVSSEPLTDGLKEASKSVASCQAVRVELPSTIHGKAAIKIVSCNSSQLENQGSNLFPIKY